MARAVGKNSVPRRLTRPRLRVNRQALNARQQKQIQEPKTWLERKMHKWTAFQTGRNRTTANGIQGLAICRKLEKNNTHD